MITSNGCASIMGREHETRLVVTHAGNACVSHDHGALRASLVARGLAGQLYSSLVRRARPAYTPLLPGATRLG